MCRESLGLMSFVDDWKFWRYLFQFYMILYGYQTGIKGEGINVELDIQDHEDHFQRTTQN